MRIMVVGIHYAVCSARYIGDAFKRLGHDVKHVGEYQANNIWGIQIDPKHNWMPDANKEDRIDGWQPDLVVISESAYQFRHPHYSDAPHVVFGMDNHVRKYWQPGIVKYFLAHYAPSLMEWTGETVWTPCGYDPTVFTPSSIPMAEREYDVAMVGVAYPRRVEIIEAMREAGLKVFAATGLLYEDYRDVYHNARISLCVSAAGDVAQRVFETAAMGCAILTDECADFERLGLRYGKDIAVFSDTQFAVNEAIDLCRGKYSQLAHFTETAPKWAAPHTWDNRAQVVLDTMFGGSNAA
jgi:hypothetical protein